MSRIFLNKNSMRTPHGYAGIVALEEIAKHLELGEDAILGRVATRPELAQLLVRVCAQPMSKVKEAARKAYVSLFAEALPSVRRQDFKDGPTWRH